MFKRELQFGNTVCTAPAVWAVLVILISSLVPHATYATVIRLRDKVTASSTLITLEDVAEISETDENTAIELKRLTLAPAPAMGRSVRINIDRIRRELTLRGIDQSKITFRGSSKALVVHERQNLKSHYSPQGTEINKMQKLLISSIRNYIQTRNPQLNSIHVEVSAKQSQLIVSQYDFINSIKVLGGQAPWTGMQRFQIQFVDRQNRIQNVPLICNVSIKQQALALKLGLPRGKVIREGDLVWIEPDNLPNSKPVFSNPEDVVGTETIKNIRAQTPIHPEDIRQLPLVKRNDIVAVTARIGGVVVRRYCRSHDEGAKGQFVTLTPVDGKAKVTARVSGFREAEIVLEDLTSAAAQPQSIQAASHSRAVQQSSNQGLQVIQPQTNAYDKTRSASYRRPASFIKPRSIQVQIQANRPVQLP